MDKAKDLIEKYLALFQHYGNDVWDIMDIDNHFIYANKNLNNIVGLNQDYAMEGRHMSEPPVACYELCADAFIEQNNTCIHTRREMKVLDIHPSINGDWFVYIFHKKPLVEAGQVIGTLHHGYSILDQWKETATLLQHFFHYYAGNKEVSAIIQTPDTLTTEQYEILFFLLCSQDPKDIAKILNVDAQVIYKRMARLKQKLGATNTKQLIEYAISSDLYKHLPPVLTGKHLSHVIDC